MSRFNNILRVIFLILAVIVALADYFVLSPTGIDNVADMAISPTGAPLILTVEDGDYVFDLLDENGVSQKSMKLEKTSGDESSVIRDFAINEQNIIYMIREYTNAYTGDFLRHDLEVYDMNKMFSNNIKTFPLENEANVRYKWVSLSSLVVLMGTNATEDTLTRTTYDAESIINVASPQIKSERIYEIDPEEGIFEVVSASDKIVYASMSGKAFVSAENEDPIEIYPARELVSIMYPMFISANDSTSVYIGEQLSGDMSVLNIENGNTQAVLGGQEQFTGVSDYTVSDILRIAMLDEYNFAALVKNNSGENYSVIVTTNGVSELVEDLNGGTMGIAMEISIFAAVLYIVLIIIQLIISVIVEQVKTSRTILVKLALTSIPLLLVAFAIFGYFNYSTYSVSIEQNFQKQVEDEGNLLTALFGAEGFDQIQYPYDYDSDAYRYLQRQFATREVYTRTAYYEGGNYYLGVDENLPCFYPLDLVGNSELSDLYTRAVYTGVAQTAVIEDTEGKRLTCITPIGGAVGSTVYLLETGIMYANVSDYTQAFLMQYATIAAIFTIVIALLLILVFRNVLSPLGAIKNGMEQFSKGDHRVRLESYSDDELADVAKVFNKMANDIDTQLYNLKSMSDTYYRFVPERIFQLLGKERLGDIELGDNVSGKYNVLIANLEILSDRLTESEIQEINNNFFNIINTVCKQYDATMLVDNIDLHDIKIVCSEGADNGIAIALGALAYVDSYNATMPLQKRMNVQFLLHLTEIVYSISGNSDMYIPAMYSTELRSIDEQMQNVRQYAARLIVTEEASKTIPEDRYYHRSIGHLEQGAHKGILLYDFYDSSSPEMIKMINNTRITFDKAMELYESERYYDAKNLFTLVLRENQYDNVARSYIFKCEKKMQNATV